MSEHLIDLDELVLRCKTDEARKYIAEAVACYKVGAFRACIVTTWIAVVCDFVYKLRELEKAGNAKAKSKLKEFDTAHDAAALNLAQNFEKEVLKSARDEFEFLSHMQHDDLDRLFQDRHRCAHPSMIVSEEIYQPPAELARYHLRNAITHLLQHPPTQGKAALTQIQKEILSVTFPKDTIKALEYFKYTPLNRASEVLVRNFTKAHLTHMLTEELDVASWLRFVAALNAASQMYLDITTKIFKIQLSAIIQKIDDLNLYRAIKFCDSIKDTWQFLNSAARIKIENYISEVDETHLDKFIDTALNIIELKNMALSRLKIVNASKLKTLIKDKPRIELIPRAIVIYGESENFESANSIAVNLTLPLIEFMTKIDIDQIFYLANENRQIVESTRFYNVMIEIKNRKLLNQEEFISLFDKYNSLSKRFYESLFP